MAAKKTNGKARLSKCPTCGKEQIVEFSPFCSKHCADLDLGRWMTESYRIPFVDEEGDDEGDDEY